MEAKLKQKDSSFGEAVHSTIDKPAVKWGDGGLSTIYEQNKEGEN